LRRSGPLDAPFERSSANFFRVVNADAHASSSVANMRANASRAMHNRPMAARTGDARKPLFIGILAMHRSFAKNLAREKIFRRDIRALIATRAQRRAPKRRLYTKLSGNTVIFLPL
jgi:hypothetical protein